MKTEKRNEDRWISVKERMPEPEQRVYVICEALNSIGKIVRYQTIAEYIPKLTVLAEDYMHEDFQEYADYDEETDNYYTCEGFYEWQSVPDMNWLIYNNVIYWMPLFLIPEN